MRMLRILIVAVGITVLASVPSVSAIDKAQQSWYLGATAGAPIVLAEHQDLPAWGLCELYSPAAWMTPAFSLGGGWGVTVDVSVNGNFRGTIEFVTDGSRYDPDTGQYRGDLFRQGICSVALMDCLSQIGGVVDNPLHFIFEGASQMIEDCIDEITIASPGAVIHYDAIGFYSSRS